jgi:nucleotide-binding universal stress UspA family protein
MSINSSYASQTTLQQAVASHSTVPRSTSADRVSGASSEFAKGLRRLGFDLRGRTVLLAMDGSDGAIAGAKVAFALAQAHGAVVNVISVIDSRAVPFPPALDVALAIEDPDRDLTTHQQQVQELRASLSKITGQVIDWPIRVVIGTPSSSIVDQAKHVDAALIIVGLRRHGRVDRALNNETSLNVMRHSTCPVLGVVPGLTVLPWRILAATDFSTTSLAASRIARAIAAEGAALVLAYVPPLTALIGDEGERTIHDLGVRAAFETAAEELGGGGITFDFLVLEHDVYKSTAAALLEYAESSHADLIAAGASNRGHIERWMIGSVSTALVRDGTHSVLIVPAASSDRRG